MARAEIIFLGTGGSSGVPMIGCNCRVCTSSNSRNQRLRPSALIRWSNKNILIDSGPDFRLQALKYQINQLDGVLVTHSHFDHIAGIDELRVYYLHTRKPMPVLLSMTTFMDLKRRCDYLFRDRSVSVSLTAQLDFHVIHEKRGTIPFLDLQIQYIQYEQGGMPVMGYRIGSFAYISDIRDYDETIFEDLSGVKILVLSALRHETSRMHFTIEQAIAFALKVGAEKVYFTHIGHELDYTETNQRLPEGMQLAYDGLKLEFEYGRD